MAKALLDGRISEKRQNASAMHRNRTEARRPGRICPVPLISATTGAARARGRGKRGCWLGDADRAAVV